MAVPIKLYLCTLKFEFYIFFMSHEIFFFGIILLSVKSIFSLQGVLKQVAGQIRPEGCGIPFT